jgi:Ca-activated chloride channel family protein
MDSRIHSTGTSLQTGFGLVAWLETTKIILPLRAVDCRFQVSGDLLSVEIDQVFHQNNSQALDCLYTFPLPAGAAVHRCEMHVNGRVIRARVEEEARARELAAEHKAAGHRTALVEMDRENLFSLSLGNLQPGDVVIVRLAYFQTLTRLQDWSSFHIPFCPGVKYIPGKPLLRSASGRGTSDDTDQVPDASRISPPRMDPGSEDAATLFIQGFVDDPDTRIRDLSSPSHPVMVRDGEKQFQVGLADGCSLPDQDFVLRWNETAAEEAGVAAWSWTTGEETYAMVRIMPPAALGREEVEKAKQVETDVYFLLDHSGSMQGLKWEKTAQAFLEFLKAMKEGDRAWLTLFSHGFQDFAEKPLPARRLLADDRAMGLPALPPGGGTEVVPALAHVVGKIAGLSKDRRVVMVLITDGQIGNEHEVLELLRKSPDLTLHVLGIDTAPNDAFLKALSDQHGGSWHQMHPNDDLVGTVRRLGARLRPAVLESLKVPAGWESASRLPARVYLGQSTVLLLKRVSSDGASELELSGQRAGGQAWTSTLGFRKGSEAVQKLWQRSRMDTWLSAGKSEQAIELAKSANLICRGAAFIAWDESQKVIVSRKEVFQPVMFRDAGISSLRGVVGFASRSSSPRAHLLFSEPTDMAADEGIDAFSQSPSQPVAGGGISGHVDYFMDLRLSEISEDDYLSSFAAKLMADPWKQATESSRKAWAQFVAHILRWLASLEKGRRGRPCRALGEILASQPLDRSLSDEVIRRLLSWLEFSMSRNYAERVEAMAAIECMRAQLPSSGTP